MHLYGSVSDFDQARYEKNKGSGNKVLYVMEEVTKTRENN